MPHVMFKNHLTFGSGEDLKVFTINGHGGHCGHVTWNVFFYKLMFPLPKKAPHKIWL